MVSLSRVSIPGRVLALCLGAAFAPGVRGANPADPLPAGAVSRFGSPRLQDFTIDRSVTFSSDGKLLATSGANTPVCVWDAATGKRVRTHANRGSVFDLRWRRDGKLSAVTFFGHDVFLMQEFTGDREAEAREAAKIEQIRIEEDRAHPAHQKPDRLNYVFLSADGTRAVAVWNDPGVTLRRIKLSKFTAGVSSASAAVERTVEVPVGYGT